MAINRINQLLRQFEFAVNDIKQKYDGKQASRLFANTVWMMDFIESRVKNQLNPIMQELEILKAQSPDVNIQNNASISIKHIQEIEKSFDSILFPYKNRYEFNHIELAWKQNLPAISDKMKSLRHRIDIISNTISTKKKIEDEDWYSNL